MRSTCLPTTQKVGVDLPGVVAEQVVHLPSSTWLLPEQSLNSAPFPTSYPKHTHSTAQRTRPWTGTRETQFPFLMALSLCVTLAKSLPLSASLILFLPFVCLGYGDFSRQRLSFAMCLCSSEHNRAWIGVRGCCNTTNTKHHNYQLFMGEGGFNLTRLKWKHCPFETYAMGKCGAGEDKSASVCSAGS